MAGLLRAQDGLRVLVDPTADRAALTAAVDALPVSGKAGLLDTVQTATSLGDAILGKAGVRLAVLFITDSDVGNYREDFTNPTINWTDSGDVSRRFRDGLIREKISKLNASLEAGDARLHPASGLPHRHTEPGLSDRPDDLGRHHRRIELLLPFPD